MNTIFDICDIRMNEVTTTQVCVPRWEVPVLQVLHGDDLQVVGQVVIERAVPDPKAEFERLAQRYGPKNENTPAVAAIYGNFGPGTNALRNEMKASLTVDDATPSTYRSIEERKADAEKAQGGESLVAEAAAAAGVKVDDDVKVAADVKSNPAKVEAPADGADVKVDGSAGGAPSVEISPEDLASLTQ